MIKIKLNGISINLIDIDVLEKFETKLSWLEQCSGKLRKYNPNISNKSGVYFIFNKEKQLVYIGQAKHLRHRLVHHLTQGFVPYDEIEYFSYILIKEKGDMFRSGIERLYMGIYHPKYNYMNS